MSHGGPVAPVEPVVPMGPNPAGDMFAVELAICSWFCKVLFGFKCVKNPGALLSGCVPHCGFNEAAVSGCHKRCLNTCYDPHASDQICWHNCLKRTCICAPDYYLNGNGICVQWDECLREDNPCREHPCGPQEECELETTECYFPPCPVKPKCVPKHVTESSILCDVNEEWLDCGDPCEKECGIQVPCNATKTYCSNAGCYCKPNFYRNKQRKCVQPSDCH